MERSTLRPEQCGGRPCIRGSRIRVIDVLEIISKQSEPAENFRGIT